MQIEFLRDGGARGVAHAFAQSRVRKQTRERGGKRRRVVLRREQAGHVGVYDFRHARHISRDDRDAHCHRFEQDGRQAIAIAVRADDARQREHSRATICRDHVILRFGPDETHLVAKPKFGDQRAERRFLRTFADDLAMEHHPAIAQLRARANQSVEPFLFDESPDAEDQRIALGMGNVIAGGIEVREINAVVQFVDAVGRNRHLRAREQTIQTAGTFLVDQAREIRVIERADGDDETRRANLVAQQVGIHRVQENIFGVRGETVRRAGEQAHEHGNTRRTAGKMRVQMRDRARAQIIGKHNRLKETFERMKVSARERVTQDTRVAARVGAEHGALRGKHAARFCRQIFRQVRHRRAHAR